MKKAFLSIIFITLLILPIKVNAVEEGISNYYIDATVIDNGDIHVKELIVLTGNFNGFERIINYQNSYAPIFDGSVNSFYGSDIYNGNEIILKSIKNIEVDNNINFNYLYHEGDNFTNVSNAYNGDYGKYTVLRSSDGEIYRIYNPSNGSKKGFYIEYVVKNVGIIHNDVAEIGWNIFSEQLDESINNLEMIINIPNNNELLKAWGHGPLNGTIDLIGKDQIKLQISDLKSKTPIDVRFVFDKSSIGNATKTTNIDALDKILQVEKKLADEANALREKELERIEQEKRIGWFLNIFNILWIIGLIIVIIKVYNKYDKEYSSTFKTKYFRDFPANYGPEIVGYLFNKKIKNNDLSASILNLVSKKVISFEEEKKNNYILKYDLKKSSKEKLTPAEDQLIKWLFDEIGNGEIVSMKDIKRAAKKNSNDFLGSFNLWKDLVLEQALKENFYEENGKVKALCLLYSIFGFGIAILTLNFPTTTALPLVVIILSILSILYFISINKRTKKGNEDYNRWKGLKNFLKDFGRFKSRDLPHINLWEKYLVYAMTFGLASKLAKTMEIKFQEIDQSNYSISPMFNIHYIGMLNGFNHTLNASVNAAVTSAIAETRRSSAAGVGGGFSGGGGSFGGGGGGGRF